jgi:hypothetical protein
MSETAFRHMVVEQGCGGGLREKGGRKHTHTYAHTYTHTYTHPHTQLYLDCGGLGADREGVGLFCVCVCVCVFVCCVFLCVCVCLFVWGIVSLRIGAAVS